MLKAFGSVIESGDGTGGNFSGLGGGDILTSAGDPDGTANSMTNRDAWFRVQWPNGRELVFQRSSFNSGVEIRVFYSSGAFGGFDGADKGPVAADVRPTAVDEQVVLGQFNEATTGRLLFEGTGRVGDSTINATIIHGMAGDVDEDYAWYAFSHFPSAGLAEGGFFMDALSGAPSYAEDPVIVGGPNENYIFSY